MIIVVENEDLRYELKKRGYDVKKLGLYVGYIDAIIYESEENFSIPNITMSINSPVLMINGNGKCIDEIENILRTKLYSPLF